MRNCKCNLFLDFFASCQFSEWSVSCPDCVPVSECLIPFSHHFHASVHLSSCFLPAWVSASLCSLFCQPVHLSVSLSALFTVCLPTFCLSVHSVCQPAFVYIGLIALCLWLLAYAVFPSLRQCFSSCQSFSLSVSPFIPFSLSSSLLPCLHVCISMLGLALLVCWLSTGRTCAMTVCLIHYHPLVYAVKYFSLMKYISL